MGSQLLSISSKEINISDNHLNGFLNLNVNIDLGSKMVKLTETGGFGPSEWTRKC